MKSLVVLILSLFMLSVNAYPVHKIFRCDFNNLLLCQQEMDKHGKLGFKFVNAERLDNQTVLYLFVNEGDEEISDKNDIQDKAE